MTNTGPFDGGGSLDGGKGFFPETGNMREFERIILVDPASNHICLSQRLSHACLSTGTVLYGENRANGSLNQLWFLGSYLVYLDNCGNSRANTCRQEAPTSGRALFSNQNQSGLVSR
ncbi:hypothetical protein JTE90_012223 [Oedothorax gibbosus]|uniref:Uncharacterized protein n=1 Tax=Oedothorax gibbosus TaxID=931172 RepID=A0AAV6TE82_9ARAC|nr:hypothetical protein JTE90_012223 [Oedothorax gibbosus]